MQVDRSIDRPREQQLGTRPLLDWTILYQYFYVCALARHVCAFPPPARCSVRVRGDRGSGRRLTPLPGRGRASMHAAFLPAQPYDIICRNEERSLGAGARPLIRPLKRPRRARVYDIHTFSHIRIRLLILHTTRSRSVVLKVPLLCPPSTQPPPRAIDRVFKCELLSPTHYYTKQIYP